MLTVPTKDTTTRIGYIYYCPHCDISWTAYKMYGGFCGVLSDRCPNPKCRKVGIEVK